MTKKFDIQGTTSKFLSGVDEDIKSVPTSKETAIQEETPAKVGREANKIKNVQVSIYLTPEMQKELRLQDALKEKETDKSAIARTGIEIALSLSNEEYSALKKAAIDRGTTPGQIVKSALISYL